MIMRVVVCMVMLLCVPPFLYAQENATMATYYPSPVGSYDTVEITRNLSVLGQSGAQVTLSSDAGGNLTINSTRSYFQLGFDSGSGGARPYSFIMPCTTSAYDCPEGYSITGYLNTSMIPGDWTTSSGYCVCTKGTE